MSTAKTNPRPSSPRRFFARIYGHLETKDEVQKDKGRNEGRIEGRNEGRIEGSDRSPEDLSVERLPVEVKKSDDDDETKRVIGQRADALGLPFLPHGFFTANGTHPLHLGHTVHPVPLPPHLHGLAGHAESHFHGFSAFRKTL